MKVLLRRNVRKLGQIGEVVDVKPGFARNYLIPQALAVEPTTGNLKRIEAEKQAYLEQLAAQREELRAKAQVVDGREITIPARANEEGHLYGSIGPAQIAAALANDGVFVETEFIDIEEPIRQLDKYDVTVRFDEEVTATIAVWVVPHHETTPGVITEDHLAEEAAPEELVSPDEAKAEANAEPQPEPEVQPDTE